VRRDGAAAAAIDVEMDEAVETANDQVDPVLKVQPVQFQRVLPRYRLSTSETRDLGVGPMFTEVPSLSVGKDRESGVSDVSREVFEVPAKQVEPRAADLESWKGSRVDLFA